MDIPVTIAICTYTDERYPLLVQAIASAEREPAADVLVVVDHNDSLLDRLRADFPRLRVIANAHERGLSGGRNTVLDHTHTDVVAFLDDDGVLAPGWVAAMTGPFGDADVVGAGSRIDPRWETARPRWLCHEFDWVIGCSHAGLPATTGRVRNPIGGAMAVRVEPARAAGGFRSDLGRVGTIPLGCEETDLFMRLAAVRPAWTVLYEPQAVMHHFVPASRCTWRYYVRRCYGEGLSKARIKTLHPAGAALATERSHVRRILTAGISRQLRRGEPLGAVGLLSGLAATVAGFAVGTVNGRFDLRVLSMPTRTHEG